MIAALPASQSPVVLVEMSAPLTLGQAQSALSGTGVGKVFALNGGRYVISAIRAVRKHGNTFGVEVVVVPLPRQE